MSQQVLESHEPAHAIQQITERDRQLTADINRKANSHSYEGSSWNARVAFRAANFERLAVLAVELVAAAEEQAVALETAEAERDQAVLLRAELSEMTMSRDHSAQLRRLAAAVTELAHHGDLTPAGKRKLEQIIVGKQ